MDTRLHVAMHSTHTHTHTHTYLEVIEVELSDQGLEAGVAEVLGEDLLLQARGVLDVEGEAVCVGVCVSVCVSV